MCIENNITNLLKKLKKIAPSPRVYLPDRSGQTGGVRFRYTGPVWPVTGRKWSNSNLNSNFPVQLVRTGIPVDLTGIPAGLAANRSV